MEDAFLQERLAGLLEQYPAFSAIPDLKASFGDGPGFAEVFHPDEPDSPTPGSWLIQIRDPTLQDEYLDRLMLGEALHFLPEHDPKYAELRSEFAKSLTGNQLRFAKKRYAYDVDRGESRPFGDWFEQVWTDALIRGFVTPDAADEFRKQGGYTKENLPALYNIRDYLGLPEFPVKD